MLFSSEWSTTLHSNPQKMCLWELPLRSFQMENSTGAGWLHCSTLPVGSSSKLVKLLSCTTKNTYKCCIVALWLNNKYLTSEASPIHTSSGSCDSSSWYHQNNNQLDHGIPPGKCDQLDQGARWLGKELAIKYSSNSSFIELLLLLACMTHANICVCCLWFLGGHSVPLWHTHMADGGSFLGWCSHHCSSHSQVVRGLWRADLWKMGRRTTEGNGDGNKNMNLKENRKKFWQSEQVEQEEPPFVSASLSFPRIGSSTECTVAPIIPVPLRKWAEHDNTCTTWGMESLSDLNRECILSNLFFTQTKYRQKSHCILFSSLKDIWTEFLFCFLIKLEFPFLFFCVIFILYFIFVPLRLLFWSSHSLHPPHNGVCMLKNASSYVFVSVNWC